MTATTQVTVLFGGQQTPVLLGENTARALAAADRAEGALSDTETQRALAEAYATDTLRQAPYGAILHYIAKTDTEGFIYDPTRLETLWQDAAGTIPVTAVGQQVRRINDVTGRGNDLVRSSATYVATLEEDADGQLYINLPFQAFFTSADAVGTTGAYSFTSAYIGAALTRAEQQSRNLFGLAASGSSGMFIKDVMNGHRMYTRVEGEFEMTSTGTSSAPVNLPTAIDVQITPTQMSTWINGGNSAPPPVTLVEDVTFPGVTGAYICIAANGRTSALHQCKFYGAIGLLDAIPNDLRQQAMSWLRQRAGQSRVDPLTHDIFLIAGQSNAMGADTNWSDSPAVPLGRGATYNDRGFLRPVRDPIQHFASSTSLYGSAWPAFCAQWFSRTGRAAAIAGQAASGCGLVISGADGNWGDSSTITARASKVWREAIDFTQSQTRGGVVRGVIWAGGEQDTASLTSGVTTVESYKAKLVDLRERIRVHLGLPDLPLYIISADRRTNGVDDLGYTRLRQAQSEVAAENEGIELVVPYQDFAGQGKMAAGSTIHWGQVAQNEVGTIAANSIATLLGWPT